MAGRPVYGAHRLQFDLPTPITVDLTRRETSRLAGSRAVFYGESVSVFSAAEIAYLERMTMGRLATVGADGRPHVVPMTFHFNAAEDTVDLGGVDFAASKKWRDMQINPKATFLVDEASPDGAHAIEIRGDAEIHVTGGESINPRFPSFVPQFVRLRPRRIVSWGLESEGFQPIARTVC